MLPSERKEIPYKVSSNCTKKTACTGLEQYFSLSVSLTYGTSCLSRLILDRCHRLCAVSATWIYLVTCIYNSVCFMCVCSMFCIMVFMSLILLHFVGQLLVHSMPCCPVML